MPLPSLVRGRRAVATAGVLVLALAVTLLVVQRRDQQRQRDAAAETAARAFAAAASRGDLAEAPLAGTPAADAAGAYATVTGGLGARPRVEVAAVRREGDTATADLRWTWPFGPRGWSYASRAPLAPAGDEDGDAWGVRWSPQVVHPELQDGEVLDATRTRAARGQVLGRGDQAIVMDRPVVDVGVQPSRATDPAALSRSLSELLDVDAGALEQRVRAAAPDAFVHVVTLRRGDYLPLRGRLQPLPGTVFRESTLPLAPSRSFARALLGSAGPVTAELVEQSDGRLAAGDVAGLSGLQRAHDARLGGTAGVRVERRGEAGAAELFVVEPVAGGPVRLTLDARVQEAADRALATTPATAALVAVDVPSGDVLAVANSPATGSDRALTGQYPPGSTFKAVSTLALLDAGLTPDATVPCPAKQEVDGRSFRNFEGGQLGDVPFRRAFGQSCNTSFVALSDRLEPQDLPEVARRVGLGVPWSVGVDVFAGDVPAAQSPVELAAATIGQGRVLASPAAMAQVAATVARGAWAAPRLVLDPAPEPSAEQPPAVDPQQAAAVRALMRGVAVEGTAAALADVPGAPVHAKTGTAEHGTETPPRTHAWTMGFQGELAFAVLVEGGRSGGEVAVPVAEAFLRGLQP